MTDSAKGSVAREVSVHFWVQFNRFGFFGVDPEPEFVQNRKFDFFLWKNGGCAGIENIFNDVALDADLRQQTSLY